MYSTSPLISPPTPALQANDLHGPHEHSFPYVPRDAHGGLGVRQQLSAHTHLCKATILGEQLADGVCDLLGSVAGVDSEAPLYHIGNVAILL